MGLLQRHFEIMYSLHHFIIPIIRLGSFKSSIFLPLPLAFEHIHSCLQVCNSLQVGSQFLCQPARAQRTKKFIASLIFYTFLHPSAMTEDKPCFFGVIISLASLPFGVPCCYGFLPTLSFFEQLSYVIFFGVHTNCSCYLGKE